ncbi:hypothetical protein KDA23_02935, partial [Candidatus Saccharibacteria bacterium]|nr:hypothetical protein [Candidatus Saccharibacteria bacterium]
LAHIIKHLVTAELNYSKAEKELYAIVPRTEYFKHYLYGRSFKVRTDHRPLRYLLTQKDPPPD